jgi:quercetin dioxygenase-like cupin family protein
MPPYAGQRDDQQRIRWLGSAWLRILLDGAATGGRLTAIEQFFGTGDGSPLHLHREEDEIFWVLEGTMTIWVGDERIDASEGDTAFLPRGIAHAFRVTSERSRALILAIPAGIEEMYREAGWDLSRPLPDGWSVSMPLLQAITDRRGTPIIGPTPET